LKEELVELEAERGHLASAKNRGSSDQARDLAFTRGRIAQLESRIGSAKLVTPADQAPDVVRFGAAVELQSADGETTRTITIVGVDESDAGEGRITFLAPVAKRMTGKKVGDSVPMPTLRGDQQFRITAISY
jgi:transcription elongation factor GreB